MVSSLPPASARIPPTNLELLGAIVRLQVQTASLKRGTRPRSWYDPSTIEVVASLGIDDGGVFGFQDGSNDPIADVHHRDHPQSKYRGENGVSIGFTSHYRQMRDRFGDHLVDGVAGENIIVRTSAPVSLQEVEPGLIVITRDGPLALKSLTSATPCTEFSKFCCRYPNERPADRLITEALRFLSDGMRGFYMSRSELPPGAPRISTGDLVYARVRDDG